MNQEANKESDLPEVTVTGMNYDGVPQLMFHKRYGYNDRASLTMAFVEKWGMIAGKDDGEDSSGRSKIVLLSPQEVVNRAIETAELLQKTLLEKGWIGKLPTFAQATEMALEAKAKREKK